MFKRVRLHALVLAAATCAVIGIATPASAAQADVDLSLTGLGLNGSDTRYSPTDGVKPGGVVYLNAGYGIQGAPTSPWTMEAELPEGFTAEARDEGCEVLAGGRRVSCRIGPDTGQNYGVMHLLVRADASLCPGTAATAHIRISSPEDSNPANIEKTIGIKVF